MLPLSSLLVPVSMGLCLLGIFHLQGKTKHTKKAKTRVKQKVCLLAHINENVCGKSWVPARPNLGIK